MSYEVKLSKINGKGLFALKRFSAGETVLVWDKSKKIARQNLASLPEEDRKYLHPLNKDFFIIVQPPERFVNHSCNNNTEFRNFTDVAARDIEIGEEITSNYEKDGAGQFFICNCGAEICRREIGKIA